MLKVRFNHDHRGPVLSFECAETPGWMIWEWIEGDELVSLTTSSAVCPVCDGETKPASSVPTRTTQASPRRESGSRKGA